MQKNEEMPKNYELLEQYLFLVVRQILIMYQNNVINSEKALILKKHAEKEYIDKVKEYEFESNMFKEHIEKIKKTQMLRIELRKLLNTPNVNFTNLLNVCIELIELYSGEEFK